MSIAMFILMGIIFLGSIILAITQREGFIIIIGLLLMTVIISLFFIIGAFINDSVTPDILAEEEVVDIVPLDLDNKYYIGTENKEELYWYLTKNESNITGLKSAPISKSTIYSSKENKRTYVLISRKTYSDSLKFFFAFSLQDKEEYAFYVPENAFFYNFNIK